MYGYFKRKTKKMAHEMTQIWLRRGNIKREIESLLVAALNDAKRSNYIQSKIDDTQQNRKYTAGGYKWSLFVCLCFMAYQPL